MSNTASTQARSAPTYASTVTMGALLAFTAGFVDTCGFVALFGLFTAHVTGNFVLIGAAIVGDSHGVVGKLLALPVFIAAVALTRLFVLGHERRKWNAARSILIAQTVFLMAFLAAGVGGAPFANGDASGAILAGMLGVTAMGIQNAASRTVFATLSPTTVMTGNVTQIVIDLVDILFARAASWEARSRLGKMLPAVVAFTGGALLGAVTYGLVGFWCLTMPILVTATVLFIPISTPPAGATAH